MPVYQEVFHMGSSLMGVISGIFFLPYAVLQISCGPLFNRFGEGQIVAIGIICSAIGSFCFAFPWEAEAVLIGRFMTGLGVGPMYLGILSYASMYFPVSEYSILIGIGFAFGSFGGLLAASPLQWLISEFGIRFVFSITGFILLILAFCLLSLSGKTKIRSTGKTGVKELFIKPFGFLTEKNTKICFFAWAIYTSFLIVIQGLWGTLWSKNAFPEYDKYSSLPVLLINIGSIFASYLAPRIFLSNKRVFALRFWAMMYVLAYFLYAVVFFASINFIAANFSAFCLGFVQMSAGIELSTFMRENEMPQNLATIMGISNFSAGLLNLAVQAGTGFMIGRIQNMTNNANFSFFIVFMFLEVLLFIMVCFIFQLKPKELNISKYRKEEH